MPQHLAGGAGIDIDGAGACTCLIVRSRRRHHDLAKTVAIQIRDRSYDFAETAQVTLAAPVMQLLAGCRGDIQASARNP